MTSRCSCGPNSLRVVEKIIWAPDEIQQRRHLLSKHALRVTEEGPLGVASCEEVIIYLLPCLMTP
jgi:hypothetical protein